MGRRHRLGLIHRPLQRDRIPRGGQGYITPAVGGDPYWANVVLLALNDNAADASTTFVDQSSYARTLTTVGDAQYDTAQAPTGMTSSGLFDGVGDRVTADDAAEMNPAAGNFTVEGYARWSVASGVREVVGYRANSAYGPWAIVSNGLSLTWYSSSINGLWNIANGKSIGTIATGSWYHFALVRNGSTFTPYLNGVAGSGTATSSATLYDTPGALSIGSNNGVLDFSGWIANFRYTIGIARYTSNFTPPTLPLPTS